MSERIGVDTNVLLRGLLGDDGGQLARATRILETEPSTEVFVNCVVLAELFWNLRAVENVPRARIVEALEGLLSTQGFAFENETAVEAALRDYRDGLGDFSDRLIARINEAHGASQTFTFDRKAARHPPLALVP
ncbi:type II toxin-antitoxin system VapC family toxin [Salinarimonas sp.]|uniref:PIN domain-containing protein n=1 Tax=Salinarimonas sp. TaxID=2766526 RepID=UPI0032D92CA3